MPPNTVSVARPGKWGNPFHVSRFRDAQTCVALFAESVRGGWNPSIGAHLTDAHCGYEEHCRWHRDWRERMNCSPWDWLHELRGKNLACWCPLDKPCHADVLLELANAPIQGTDR
jgi:hypothetical protein